ncbi:ABC transporter permease [Flaviflexus equikiangi]|uniref:ABC transporter permease n=1 Tax=Flaviflexus equikiangi TaxID=2758573 RepID=UPI0015F3D46F|nr:ABC transporter permease [Flaviflexus equikiangi]
MITARRVNLGAWLSLAYLLVLLIAAIAPSLIAPGDPLAVAPADGFAAPSLEHWFGTDESGRDTFRRVVHGTRDSLIIGVAATGVGVVLAMILGIGAALGPRWVDFGANRLIEVLFALPGVVLALLLITVLGPGVVTSTLAVGVAAAPGYARMIRAQTVTIASSGYVEADRALGRTPGQILRRRIFPNLVAPLFVIATLGVGQGVVWASALSYLGLGVSPPSPEWGAMMNAGRTYLTSSAWWLTLFPGLAIILTAVSTTALSRAIAARSRRDS